MRSSLELIEHARTAADFPKASAMMQDLVRQVREVDNQDPFKLYVLNSAGILFHEMSQPGTAKRVYEDALRVLEQRQSVQAEARATLYENAATLYLDTRDIGKASALTNKLEDLLITARMDDGHLSKLYILRGRIAAYKNDLTNAHAYLKRAVALAERNSGRFMTTHALFDLGLVEVEMDLNDDAIEHLNRYARQLTGADVNGRLGVLFALAAAYRKKSPQTALQLSNEGIALSSRMFGEQSSSYARCLQLHACNLKAAALKKQAKEASSRSELILRTAGETINPHTIDVWSLRR